MAHAVSKTVSRALKAGTAAGLAAAILFTGVPMATISAHAEAVKVEGAQTVPSFADVVSAVSPAVVSVRVKSNITPASSEDGFNFNFGGPGFDRLPDDHPLKRFFEDFGGPQRQDQGGHFRPHGKHKLRPTAQGSGFFISADGYIVTNNHVVADGEAFTVVLNDGTELDAKLVGKDKRSDLAVLKVDDKRTFTYVAFADDSKVRVGDWVVAVGNPFGFGGTVTAGIVSARGRDIKSGPYDDYIQIDAAINHGNSGGPTFNLGGEVVGINTAIFAPNGTNLGIAFAIPSSLAKTVVDDLIKYGSVERGWLGVQIQDVDKDIAESLGLADAQGALVIAPQAGSPGEKAGIVKGDVITAVDGDTIKGTKELARKIAGMRPGTDVEVAIWRDGKAETVKLTIGKLPDEKQLASTGEDNSQGGANDNAPASLDQLGIEVEPSDDGRGVTIVAIDPNSDAAAAGIRKGDFITAVNNQEIQSASDIVKVLEDAKAEGRKKALFQIESERGSRFVALDIAQG